jgi:hypothetical protein
MFNSSMPKPVSSALLTLALAGVGIGITGAACASTAYDGNWSVVINTRAGSCPPSVRYGVNIINGQVVNGGNSPVDVQGRVTPRGAVTVMVNSGNASAIGSGRLGHVTGAGMRRGQSSAGSCAGTWVAQRRGYGASPPTYDYYNGGGQPYNGQQPYARGQYGWSR